MLFIRRKLTSKFWKKTFLSIGGFLTLAFMDIMFGSGSFVSCILTAFHIIPTSYSDDIQDPKVICYYTNWSQYRSSGGRITPEDVDPTLCTHIVYAFAKLSGGVLGPTEWNDISTTWSTGMYERINRLKANSPGLKTMLSLGGWQMGSHDFIQMASSAESRHRFARTTVGFLRRHGFNGLDVDWEYPAGRGSPQHDKVKFSLLLQDLRDQFEAEAHRENRTCLLLSAKVPAIKTHIDEGYSAINLSRCLDFISVMSYDFHGGWEHTTGSHNALYASPKEVGPQTQLNQDWAVNYWLRQGIPRRKLILGIPAFGRTWTLQHSLEHNVGSPAMGSGSPGIYTRESGLLSYYEICDKTRQGWNAVWHNHFKVPYSYGDDQWVSFEDHHSIAIKAKYIKQNGLGGAMFWSLDMDDYNGRYCKRGQFPLLTALNKSLNRKLPS